MMLAAPSPTPDGEVVLLTALDLGKPVVRDCCAEFASQPCIESARSNSSTTNEPAYRLLQILTRLRGDKPRQ